MYWDLNILHQISANSHSGRNIRHRTPFIIRAVLPVDVLDLVKLMIAVFGTRPSRRLERGSQAGPQLVEK